VEGVLCFWPQRKLRRVRSTALFLMAMVLSPLGACAPAGSAGRTADDVSRVDVEAEPVDAGVRQAMREVPIAMYITTWCPVCVRARGWLTRNGYRFVEHDVEKDERAAMIHRALSPRGSVPMFDVDGTVVIGFNPAVLNAVILRAVRERGTLRTAGALR
jgi:glutaredoxin